VMLCCILAVIIITVLFETAEHNLVHHTPKTFLPVLTALFSELTVNGFIGVLVFFLTAAEVIKDGPGEKKSVLKWLSGQLFSGEEKWETLPEIFEKVHMIIFANMLVLMMSTVGGLGFSIWTRNVGQRMEEYCQDVLAQQLFNKSQADHAKDADQSGAQKALAEKEHIKQIATEPPGWTPGWYGTGQYFHLRQRFVLISQQDWDFDFASYCSSALSRVFIETIEIPKMAWLLVALFISAAWAVEHWALGDEGRSTVVLIVGLDYALCLGIGLLYARTVWIRKQLSPQRPQYAADQQPQLTASWNDDQQSVSEEWAGPPIEAQVHAALRVGARVEHPTRPHKTWRDASGLGSVVEVVADDPTGKPFKVKYDNGEVLQYSALTAVKLRKVHQGERLLEIGADAAIDGMPLNPVNPKDDGTQIDPVKYLYFGLHEGAEKLQVVLTTVLLLSCTYVSVLLCLLLKALDEIHPAMIVVACLPIIPQFALLYLTMRNFSLCNCLEFGIDHALKKKIARNGKLRKTIDQLHRLVQLKDLAKRVHATGDTAASMKKVVLDDIDPSEKRIMHDLFVLVDADDSGEITADEMRQALLTLGNDLDEKSIEKLVGLMDSDGSGEIGFAEFACVLEGLKRARATGAAQHEVALGSPEFIEMLFSIFDNDGAGTVTFDEVAAVLTKFGSWDMAEMSQLFREMDSSGGGDVDMQEFALFVRTILEG